MARSRPSFAVLVLDALGRTTQARSSALSPPRRAPLDAPAKDVRPRAGTRIPRTRPSRGAPRGPRDVARELGQPRGPRAVTTCRKSQRPSAQIRKCGDGGGRSLSWVVLVDEPRVARRARQPGSAASAGAGRSSACAACGGSSRSPSGWAATPQITASTYRQPAAGRRCKAAARAARVVAAPGRRACACPASSRFREQREFSAGARSHRRRPAHHGRACEPRP
jgi:hypothetical protein